VAVTNPIEQQWIAVDHYLGQSLFPSDPVLEAALQASAVAGLPPIQVSACQGRLLQLLAQIQGARRILEIGTLGGYSTIWLARGLAADGRLITLELDPHHAEVARTNLARANLLAQVELRVGPALDSLTKLAAEGAGPFDLIFIDADKPSTPEYLNRARKLSRPGTLIIVDNVIRKGALVDANSADPAVVGMRRVIDMLGSLPDLSATAIQTVGSKGYDGFAIARVLRTE
jgi:predicted O-methyltransferase YrrM